MLVDVAVAEIGSTVTKVHAFTALGGRRPRWLGGAAAPTTVERGDVTIGLREAVAGLGRRLGEDVTWRRMLAASSAAGGLRMSVHGLVEDMTVRAAREAALGAGAILDLVTAGKMGPGETEALRAAGPGVVLLAGGVENGDREVVVHNAKAIAASGWSGPVVYAGNGAAREEAVDALRQAGLSVTVAANVYPGVDRFDVEPARRAVQSVFEARIVRAPGMERVREMVEGTIRPTPGAVMTSAVVLADLIGDLVVIDVGGATTDVHSVTEGSAEIRRLQVRPEPVAKRTVEGDLGVFVNAAHLVRVVGPAEVLRRYRRLGGAPAGATADGQVEALLTRLRPLPAEEMEPDLGAFVEALAQAAAETALVRHAGRLRDLFGPTGRVTVAEGKDLTRVEWIIGTGGPLARFPRGLDTLARLSGMRRSGGARGLLLLPGPGAKPLVDRRYVMAALGVLHEEYPEAAQRLLSESFAGEG